MKNNDINILKQDFLLSDLEIKLINYYIDELIDYNNKYNLISRKNNYDDLFNRHILDSIQLIKFIDNKNINLIDFGSGGGFPGIILAILNIKNIFLIEKSYRKCQFLQKIANYIESELNNNISIINSNLESYFNNKDNIKYDFITARAFSNLDNLLYYISLMNRKNLLSKKYNIYFLKGEKIENEIKIAKKKYDFKYKLYDSITSKEGKIISIIL